MGGEAAGKGHGSWKRTPNGLMATQSVMTEALFSPGALAVAAAYGALGSDLTAQADPRFNALCVWAGASALVSLIRSYTTIPVRFLNHLVWLVIPATIAAAAWQRQAVLWIGVYITARTIWLSAAALFRSSPTEAMLRHKVSDAESKSPPMRILLATDAVPPKLDGVAVFTHHACKELPRQGHKVHVLTSLPGEEQIEGCDVTRVFGLRPMYYPEHSISIPMPWDLVNVFWGFRPHAVHIMDASACLSVAVGCFCWAFEIPCVQSHHTRVDMYATYLLPIVPSPVPELIMYLFRRITTGFAGVNLAVCMPLADQMVDRFGCRPHRVRMWHSGTDTHSFRPSLRNEDTRRDLLNAPDVDEEAADHSPDDASSGKSTPAELPVVLYVGRIAPEKDVDIIPAMARIVNPPGQPPRAKIIVVGKGPTMDELRESLKGTGVAMVGPRFGAELQRIYASSDVFLTTCTTEAFCLVGLEAMASGLPVVGPNSGGVMELFDDGVDGIFYPPRDPKGAAAAVIKAIEVHGAADTECAMRKSARAKVEAQSWGRTYQQATQNAMELIVGL